jgi:hypothetical protein
LLRLAFLVLALVIGLAPTARAIPFDLIYLDHVNATLCNNGCGITLAGSDFALIVNKNAFDITGANMYSTTFTSNSSRPEISLVPFVNNPGGGDPTPIHPNEAVGSVSGTPDNNVLLTEIVAPEVFRNSAPVQFLAFQIQRTGFNAYVGPVVFDITMTMGADRAQFSILADIALGPHAISFKSANRVSSVPLATASTVTTWGAIKTLYR